MITLWIVIGIAVLIVGYVVYAFYDDEGLGSAIFALIPSTGLATIVVLLLTAIIGSASSHTIKYEKNIGPLKAIEVTHETSAHYSSFFFMASGSVSGKAVYYFYGANGPGYTLQHIDADQAIIVETDATPHIGVYCHKITHNQLWSPPISFDNSGCDDSTDPDIGDTYIFYVPKGSITTSIKLGLP
jgi:hypothetical protein